MYSHETTIRVRYSETDKMGYVYYGNYPQYYEVGRVELMRSLGYSYKKLEEMGIIMPVQSLQIQYLRPAFYDEELLIKTTVNDMPTSRMRFEYEIYNSDKQLINKGEATLGFIDAVKRRPTRPPSGILDRFKYFISQTSK